MPAPRSSGHEPRVGDASEHPTPTSEATSPASVAGALALAFERSEQGVLVATGSGGRWANPAAARLLGVETREARERPLAALLPELRAAGDDELVIVRGGARVALRVVRDEQDATTVVYLTDAGPAPDSSTGSPAIEVRLPRVAEHSSKVIWLTTADHSTVLYLSPSFERVVGWPADVLRDGLRGLLEIVHPDDRERVRSVIERGSEGPWEHEYRVIRPDGTVRWVCDLGFPVRDETGRIDRYVGLTEDITEARARDGALRNSEAEMRALLGAMTDLIFVVDRAGRHLKVGPTSPELLYRPAELVLDRTLHEIFPAQLAEESLAAVRRALDEQRTVVFEYDLPIDGTRRWFSAALSPMDANQVVWVARDVTELHAAARALRASEERYRLLFESNPVPMMLFDEQSLAFIAMNDAAVAQYGWSREELARMTIRDIRPPTELADLERFFPWAPDGRRLPGPRWHWRKDGSAFPVDVSVHRLTIGDRVARLAMAQDVTERVRAERERQEAYDRLAALVDRSPLAIVGVDAEWRVSTWNRAAERIFGYSREEVMGRPMPHIPEERREDLALFERIVAEGGEGLTNLETQRRRKDGSLVDVLVSTATITGADGRPTTMAFLTDISERRQLEEKLRQAQKMEAVGRLAGGIAHDFNNILTAIINYSEMLLQRFAADESVRGDLAEILRAAQRAAGLTRQLLAFSRRQVLQPRLIDLGEVVRGMEAMLRPVIGGNIRLETTLATEPGMVRADRGQIEQVVLNLAVNAGDAMPAGGTVRLAVDQRRLSAQEAERHPGAAAGDYMVLSVTDQGHGMPPETVARAFEPFFTTKEAGKGTGLGLATVYGIVQQSGGFITVESRVGEGTTFSVFLPRCVGDTAADGDRSPRPLTAGHESILLVEDDDAVRAVARRMLGRHGYRVIEASNGREALELLERDGASVDLVLTDVVMPELGGPALAERLTALELTPAVLYMSGYTDPTLLERGELPEGTRFLEKPFTEEGLLSHIREALEAHRAGGGG